MTATVEADARTGLHAALIKAVGEANVFTGEGIDDRYKVDLLQMSRCEPAFLVRPANTAEVAAVMRAANEYNIPVTPLGGRTGLVGGGMTDGIQISLERMSAIEEIDTTAMTMTVGAGCVLQTAHEAAEAQGTLLPLDLGARGTATIGGVIGTNAGGNRVLRWGMMADMVLGLEAVMADGTVITSLTKMLKDNAGYHWKHLLVGSEGTLGIVTRAVLRLRPLPRSIQTAIVALPTFDAVVSTLRKLDAALAGRLSSFEVMWQDFYERVTEGNRAKREPPLPGGSPYYALVESMGDDPEDEAPIFEKALARLLDDGLATDAVIAQSEGQRQDLWAVREDLATLLSLNAADTFDVSMALGDMPRFIEDARRRLKERFGEYEMVCYGHAGDGNLHAIVAIGRSGHEAKYEVDEVVFESVRMVGGSIVGEHGVGTTRRPFMDRTRTADEIELMKRLKLAFDPKNLLNPGKIVVLQ